MHEPSDEGTRAARFGRRSLLGTMMMGAIALAGCSTSSTTKLTGTELNGAPAPDFALTDAQGATVRLSDFRGRAVALSFIFTTCPDICPLIASQMRAAYDLLPEATRDAVVFLGVSVDPERDTPAALRDFSARFGLDEVPGWHALTGSRPELEAVWAAYGIDAVAIAEEVNAHGTGQRGVARVRHTDAIYVIDASGKQRVLLRSNADPADLAANLKALAP